MATRQRKTLGQYSKRYQAQVIKGAKIRYGLTPAQTRRAFNRGTYRPGTKSREAILPRNVRQVLAGPRKNQSVEDWAERLSKSQIKSLARFQSPSDPNIPSIVLRESYVDEHGKWQNPFWYN